MKNHWDFWHSFFHTKFLKSVCFILQHISTCTSHISNAQQPPGAGVSHTDSSGLDHWEWASQCGNWNLDGGFHLSSCLNLNSFPLDDHKPSVLLSLGYPQFLTPVMLVPWFPWLTRKFAGSWPGHICCGAVTLDSNGSATWGHCVWREGPRAKNVFLKLIPLWISQVVRILGVPAASLLLRALEPLGPRGWALGRGLLKVPLSQETECHLSPAPVCQSSQQMGESCLY